MDSPTINSVDYNLGKATRVFEEHGDFIHEVLSYQAKNDALVEDLFQDFFLSLVSRPIPPGIENIKGYIYRALVHDSIDANRRIERYENKIEQYAEQHDNFINNHTPEDAFIEGERTDEFFDLITEWLSDSEKRAVTLRYKNNSDIDEVAKKLNINKRSASRYISIGLKKIRYFLRVKHED